MGRENDCAGEGVTQSPQGAPEGETPRSVRLAADGILTADHAANFLSALIGDTMTGAVREKTANSACNAMGKLLKTVDMQHRYGGEDKRPLKLADPCAGRPSALDARRAELLKELAALESSRA